MSNLTFQGCDPSAHTVCYRGGLGRLYTLSVDVDPALGVKHGTILQEVSTRAQYVVVGVSVVEGGLANGDATSSGKHHHGQELWVHQRGAKHATCIKGLTDTTDLQKQFSIVGRSTDSSGSVFLGPLGTSYQFSTSSSALTTQWGVTAGEQYYLKHFEENVRVCGELFGVLWVTKESQPNIAIPLSLCTSEDVLHSVFGLCQYVHAPKSGGAMTPRRTDDMLVPSPRRATNTPRHASQGGGAPLNLDIDRSKEIATCNGPFGSTVRCSFSQEALGPFGVSFNQKLVTKKGLDAGRFCRVVGISNRSLFVLYDGDTRVTCIRGVSNGKELEEAFGAGKGPSTDDAKRSPSPAAKGGKNNTTNDEPLASPRRPKAQKRFWTAFGRLPFDTSDSCCAPFGFPHGKVIRINNGILAGKQFTVVGVRSGALWVVEDGSSRCIPLSHCQNKTELLKMYKIESAAGAPKRNLTALYQLESEPPATPMNSPRHRLSASPERVAHNNDRALQYSPAAGEYNSPSPARSDNNPATTVTSSSHHAAAAAQSSPVPKSVPFLNLTNTDSYEAAAPVAKVPSYQMASPAASVAAAKGNVNNTMMSTTPSEGGASLSTAAPRIQDLAAGSARQYLKAFALLKMGVSLHSVASSPTASLAFHEYYMQDTMKRIREAFDRLPKVKALWEHENRTPANFFAADCAVLLKFLQERPSVTTYR